MPLKFEWNDSYTLVVYNNKDDSAEISVENQQFSEIHISNKYSLYLITLLPLNIMDI